MVGHISDFGSKNTSSAYRVSLKAAAETGRVHFWNVTELTNDVGNWGQEFQSWTDRLGSW